MNIPIPGFDFPDMTPDEEASRDVDLAVFIENGPFHLSFGGHPFVSFSARTAGNTATLTFADASAVFERGSNEFFVVRHMMNRGRVERRVLWQHIALKHRLSKQQIKTAVLGINEEVRKAVKVNQNLLEWENGFLVRKA